MHDSPSLEQAEPERPGRPVPRTRFGQFLFGTDPLQVLRLRRTLIGLVSYFMFVPAIATVAAFGWLRGGWGTLGMLVALALLVNAVFFLAIRTGFTKTFADPALTAVQIGAATLLLLLLLASLRERIDLFLPLYFTSFFFGVFRLERREYARVAAFATLAFVAFFLYRVASAGYPVPAVQVDAVRVLVLLTLLVWMSAMGGYVTRLRRTNARQRAALAQAMGRIRELLVHDELTGAYNRRHLWEILERETARLERRRRGGSSTDLAVAVIDLDEFKSVNDTYGHLVGDEVLRAVAGRIAREVRRQDWVAHPAGPGDGTLVRFGGDEFILVLPETDAEGARACLERVLARVGGEPVSTAAGPLPLTLSIGAAVWTPGEAVADLLARADRALYEAKSAGRNRVVVQGRGGEGAPGPGADPGACPLPVP